ncbi:telomere-associated helicase [Fusarium mundagurra]|uniref:Telomere-associated helicase n=1 Tax=Fusarium mundagurra TaxID=1567541 RepID=A0A8H5YPH9_9HYPO|nr:telomere-associated helicase [Fusarium mundagurra]
MEELLSLRNYGQVIARTDTPPHLLRWSDNGQVVSLGDEISISMSQFRRLPEHFIKEAATLCNEMMFAWDPAIDLANITDDMTNNKEGFSFVLHPRNNDEYYTLLGRSPLFGASIVLNPDLGFRWLETNWTSPEQLQWLRDAKDGIKVYFERWYSKNDDNVSESVFITPSLTPNLGKVVNSNGITGSNQNS